ncbi:MAG: TetR/AcrR family transcriptional regulator [Actinomycetota bacterium]|nr:TetR/AcrR family transcriptional regulator [Actinomycetota bacterium]
MSRRDEQREATRRRIVETAVELLVSSGVAATTSSAVQRKAGLSRGAILHHFPTHESLLAATVRRLVEINEQTAKDAALGKTESEDPVTSAIRTLRQVVESPYFGAELGLWSAATADPALREVLRREEAISRRDLYRVVDNVFGEEFASRPRYPVAASLTVVFLRGLAISHSLASKSSADQLMEEWAGLVREMLTDDHSDPPQSGQTDNGGQKSG